MNAAVESLAEETLQAPVEQDVHESAAETAIEPMRGDTVVTSARDTFETPLREPAFLKSLETAPLALSRKVDLRTKFGHDVVDMPMNDFEAKILGHIDEQRDEMANTDVNVSQKSFCILSSSNPLNHGEPDDLFD